MQRHLVITNDHEIFGNGTGDVRQHMVDPTERMAKICEKHGVRLTIFFEVEEYLAFLKFAGKLREHLGYDPARLIREQIIDLARRGHDIQLHLHPEWYLARYENNQWKLRMDRQTVDSLFESETDAVDYIAERKAVIDEMLESAGVTRRVQVYRAGAFSAQPGQKLLPALRANGLIIDSSVCKGLTRRNGFDYRAAPSAKGPWPISDDVAVKDSAGKLWEFPIYSEMGRRWQQATFGRLKAKFSRSIPKGRRDQMVEQLGIKRTPLGIVKFLAQPVPIKLDYHNVSCGKLLRMIDNAPRPANGEPDVLVLIGHSKEHLNDEPFHRFLESVNLRTDLKVVTFDEVANSLRSHPKNRSLSPKS
jgi:hypothetical protein